MQDNPVGDHVLSWIGNGASIGAVVSAMLGWLPPAAALIAFIWYLIQIYESKTIQRWIANKRARKIARMKATAAHLTASALILEAKARGQLPGPGEDDDEL